MPEAPAAGLPRAASEEVAAVRERYELPEDYLLWVGGLQIPDPRKRVAALAGAPRTLPLVLVGPARRWAHELPGVTLTGQVADDDLAAIYTGAHALVFPSDEEGFGLPPVEALACGTPVVACDLPGLREVLGGRATFVEPATSPGWSPPPRRRAGRRRPAGVDLGGRRAGDLGRLRGSRRLTQHAQEGRSPVTSSSRASNRPRSTPGKRNSAGRIAANPSCSSVALIRPRSSIVWTSVEIRVEPSLELGERLQAEVEVAHLQRSPEFPTYGLRSCQPSSAGRKSNGEASSMLMSSSSLRSFRARRSSSESGSGRTSTSRVDGLHPMTTALDPPTRYSVCGARTRRPRAAEQLVDPVAIDVRAHDARRRA